MIFKRLTEICELKSIIPKGQQNTSAVFFKSEGKISIIINKYWLNTLGVVGLCREFHGDREPRDMVRRLMSPWGDQTETCLTSTKLVLQSCVSYPAQPSETVHIPRMHLTFYMLVCFDGCLFLMGSSSRTGECVFFNFILPMPTTIFEK